MGDSRVGTSSAVLSVACSSDSSLLASGREDKTAKLWDVEGQEGDCHSQWAPPGCSRRGIQWRSARFWHREVGTGTVKLWDVRAGPRKGLLHGAHGRSELLGSLVLTVCFWHREALMGQ